MILYLNAVLEKMVLILIKKRVIIQHQKGLFNLKKLYFRKDRVGTPKCKLNKKIIKRDMAWCDDPKT